MHIFRIINIFLVITFLGNASLAARDVLLEFKGAYFLPINHTLRKAYNNGSALYGPELTVQLGKSGHWTRNIHGFISADYFQKKGVRLGLGDSTTLRLVPLTIGLKYMLPVASRVDFYAGLGFESLFIQAHNHRACIFTKKTKWAFGGETKLGALFNLGRNIIMDLFFDFSFIKTNINSFFYGPTITSCKVDLSSALFGIGLGYRF